MINLLPQNEKKQLLRERQLRLGAIILAALFILEMLGILLFTPAYYALNLSTEGLAQSLLARQALSPDGSDKAQASLTTIKKEIALLKPSAGIVDMHPSILFGELIAQKPKGIELNALAYARTTDGVSIQFSGNAQTQEDLLAFRRNVQMNPRVMDFKYGSSFITKKTNINFTAVAIFNKQ